MKQRDLNKSTAQKEAEMVARSQEAVINDPNWMTAAQIAHIAGVSNDLIASHLGRWKNDKMIFQFTARERSTSLHGGLNVMLTTDRSQS